MHVATYDFGAEMTYVALGRVDRNGTYGLDMGMPVTIKPSCIALFWRHFVRRLACVRWHGLLPADSEDR